LAEISRQKMIFSRICKPKKSIKIGTQKIPARFEAKVLGDDIWSLVDEVC